MKRESIRYGPGTGQVAEVWRPAGAAEQLPVVVLIHGGFWRQLYTKQLMHRLARAVTAQGWMAYNIEYRRVGRFGRGGWPGTFEDVSDAIDALARIDGVDRRRVATCGHSAGGQLALRQFVGRGAVQALMGGGPDDQADRYRLGSPAALLPLGKPQLLLHGLRDGTVPAWLSELYALTAEGLGDAATFVPLPGLGHMELISGSGAPILELTAWLDAVFRR